MKNFIALSTTFLVVYNTLAAHTAWTSYKSDDDPLPGGPIGPDPGWPYRGKGSLVPVMGALLATGLHGLAISAATTPRPGRVATGGNTAGR